jgi:hypothetical protein
MGIGKKILEIKPEFVRKLRKSRLRWLEDAENRLREPKMKRWRERANKKENEHLLLKGTMLLNRLQRQKLRN